MPVASYANGFAPRDGSPRYPSLWAGCVGAWNPGLGPSGLVLRDWSGYGHHGTLTNMDPGTDWIVGPDAYGLDFDGVDDQVVMGNVGTYIQDNLPWTVYCDCQLPSLNSQFAIISDWAQGVSSGWVLSTNYPSGRQFVFTMSNPSSSSYRAVGTTTAYVDGTRYRVVVTYAGNSSGAGMRFFVNGVESATTISSNVAPGALVSGSFQTGGKTLSSGNAFAGRFREAAIWSRALHPNEVSLLSSGQSIAYELSPRRRGPAQLPTFNPAWVARRSQVIGSGV